MATSNKEIISKTLISKMLRCIEEYEAIKRKESKKFKTVKEFCEYYGFSRQNFLKIYNRYKLNPVPESLLPQKRGPKYSKRRIDLETEKEVVNLRELGNNKYEINNILKDRGAKVVPSPTTIYNIFKKYKLNKLGKKEKTERRRYVMEKVGELVHIDLHQISKGITIAEPNKGYYILGLIDDCSRVCWLELIEDKKGLTVMFAVLKAFNMLRMRYGIEIDRVMTDNGSEFGSGRYAKNKEEHPFERLLMEMKMKHLYTKPYCPQTNGKIERFWKTLDEDLIEDSLFNDKKDFEEEILKYIVYYNEHRPHSALNGSTPAEKCKKEINNKKNDKNDDKK